VFERSSRLVPAAAVCWIAAALAADPPPVTDPTAPPYEIRSEIPSATVQGSPLLLQSTHVSRSSRSAVINDRVVAVGSRIDGAVVTAIEQGRVTLRRDAESIVLTLLLPPVKRAAKDSG
jgi:hypothetical protein